jgi:hypothetical protein
MPLTFPAMAVRGLAIRGLALALFAAAGLYGCDDAPPAKAPAEASGPAKPVNTDAVLPAKFVAAVSAGKTATALSVHFSLEAPPAVGKPLPVEIAIVPHRPFASVRALFETPEALSMPAGNRFEEQKDVKSEVVLTHRMQLRPSQEGVFLITAAVETEGEEGSVTRIYSIPVIVHAAPGAPAAAPAPAAPPATG